MRTRTTVTYDGMEFAPGAQFIVIKPCLLHGMTTTGPSAWSYWSQDLAPGDVVTCLGHGMGWGSDPGFGVEFTSPESEAASAAHCEISPSAGTQWSLHPVAGLLVPRQAKGDEHERSALAG